MPEKIDIKTSALKANEEIAARVRQRMAENKISGANLVSSPGAGKTTLLEKTIAALGNRLRLAVIAGDVQTERDADRLRRAGCAEVAAIVTAGACHLDARMVEKALKPFDLSRLDLLFIENVGNLVCPSSYDLGEDMKIVVMSAPEGDDKPLKYPAMFRKSSVLIINKIDLLGRSDFDLDRARQHALQINAALKTFDISCATGAGLDNWFTWLTNQVRKKQSSS